MRRDSPQLGALESSCGALILEQLALLQQDGSRVRNVGTFLNQAEIVFLVVDADAI
jgi:hypothetical protein